MPDYIKYTGDLDTDNAIDVIAGTIEQIRDRGRAQCKYCGTYFYGTLAECLEQLGEHAEAGEEFCSLRSQVLEMFDKNLL